MSIVRLIEAELLGWDRRHVGVLAGLYDRTRDTDGFSDAVVDLATNPHTQVGATWLLKRHHENGHRLAAEQTGRLLLVGTQSDEWEAVLHILQIVPFYDDWSAQVEALEALVRANLDHKRPFVRTAATQAFAELARSAPEFTDELISRCESALQGESASVKARVRHILRALVVALVWLALPMGAAAQMASNPEIRTELARILESQHQLQGQVGLVAAVRFPDGSIWTGVEGWANPVTGEELLPDNRFGFASITKTFVAAVVLQLVDEGLLSLDDPLGQHVGPFRYVNSGITIRQLLGHSSGVYNYTDHPDRVRIIREDLNRVWTPEEVLDRFLRPPLYFAGTGASYSNSNFLLLHTVIEAVTGNTLGDELRARVIEPHGLNETTFGGDEPPNGTVATTWSDINGNGTLDDFRELYLAVSHNSARAAPGSMFSTVSDIARWAKHLFDPSMFSAGTRRDLLDWHPLSGVGAVWTGYGQGVQQFSFAGTEAWGHSGWINGSRSIMVYAPDLGFSVAAVDNDATSNHHLTASAFVEYLRVLDYTSTSNAEIPTVPPEPSIYPNPASPGNVLRISGVSEAQLELFDLLGRRVASVRVSAETLELNRTSPGTYFWRLIGPGRTATGRLVVR